MCSSRTSKSSSSTTRVPRTRTGCWTCRDRSVKCDEARPRCGKCHKANLTCQYGIRLQWLEDSVARGIRHGREGAWRPKHKDVPPEVRFEESPGSTRYRARLKGVAYFLNTFSRDIELYWHSQACKEILDDITIYKEAENDDEDDWIEQQLVARAHVKEHFGLNSSRCYDKFGSPRWKPTSPVGSSIGFSCRMTQLDDYILKYYNAVVCASASLVDDQRHNPLRYLILPMAAHSNTVFAALLAVGAVKMAYNDPRYLHRALVHRQRVLTDLNKFIQGSLSDTSKCLEALVSAVMLCWYDISDQCRATWTSHIVGISGLLDACQGQASRSPGHETLLQFSQQYLMYHLVMAKSTLHVDGVIPNSKSILSRLIGVSSSPTRNRDDRDGVHERAPRNSTSVNEEPEERIEPCLASFFLDNELDEIDTHQGFSNRLLLLINDICDLRDSECSGKAGDANADTSALERRVIQIQSQLECLTQVPPKSVLQSSRDRREDYQTQPLLNEFHKRRLELITMTAETNRLAALLFLDETCGTHFPHIIPRCRKSRPDFIQKVLSLIQDICDTGPITAALPIWPVFVAGCMASSDDIRLQVLEIFDKFQRQKKFGSLPPALAVIRMVWNQRDLGCDENPRKVSSPISVSDSTGTGNGKKDKGARYSWERAISMLGGSSLLSLT
ncbi:uncharacterized protein F4822DRAFT_298391 [Hypoxylon trugodes]|uniref:uncharacterized protein n=1 Tax=Hypoxylon trugodes TaxID=326681 RepID=UPI00219E677D|nr:uncharacterized protein F4822DRAFT_298391 [Hypoxylon trugodes]KAI1387989.1 hypothetical protein F4822DRAFT_298391 [Hypoxylon trugodes]